MLGCFDRVVLIGTLREIAHPKAMDSFLYQEGFRAIEIGKFAEPLGQRIRDNVVNLAWGAGVEIKYLSRSKGVPLSLPSTCPPEGFSPRAHLWLVEPRGQGAL